MSILKLFKKVWTFQCYDNTRGDPMTLTFTNRQAFHDYLVKHSDSNEGIWISFSKNHDQPTLTPHDALLEALSFGWIDGQIKKIDDSTYIKYFKKRSKTSI